MERGQLHEPAGEDWFQRAKFSVWLQEMGDMWKSYLNTRPLKSELKIGVTIVLERSDYLIICLR